MIRIAAWNVQHPDEQREAGLAAVLHTLAADLWVLVDGQPTISPGEGYHLAAYARGDENRSVSVWSRFPARAIDISAPAPAVAALVDLPGDDRLVLYGTRMPGLDGASERARRAKERSYDRIVEAQRADWSRLRQSHPAAVLCVAGSFNRELTVKSWAELEAHPDALASALNEAGLYSPATGKGDPLRGYYGTRRVSTDHICVPYLVPVHGFGVWPRSSKLDETVCGRHLLWMELDLGDGRSCEPDDIMEIILERTPCFGDCPVYTVRLGRDGSATFDGSMTAPRRGRFVGRIEGEDFDRLARLVLEHNFFGLRSRYAEPITDHASTITTVVTGTCGVKRVDNYACSGPQRLERLELAIDREADRIEWRQAATEERSPTQ